MYQEDEVQTYLHEQMKRTKCNGKKAEVTDVFVSSSETQKRKFHKRVK